MSISKKVLEHPVLTVCIFALIVIVAIFTAGNIKIDLMPDMDSPVAMIYTSYDNAGPESVEKSVTEILESGVVSVSNLKSMTSESSEGASTIKLEFNYGTDMDVAVNDIRDKLDQVKGNLPDDCDTPQIFQFDSSSMPIMTLAINGNRTAEELRKIADDQIADRLEQAAGVASASVSGGRDTIVRVELEQNRLDAYGLTLSSIVSTLSSQNLEVGGGNISEGTRKYMVRTTGEYSSIDEINDTVVGTYNDYDVKLSDVGKAFMGYEDETSRIYINGKPGVYVKIQKQSGSNTVNVANSVYKKIEQIKQILPSDVTITIMSDDSTDVKDTLKELVKSIIEGFILAVVILFVFLRSAKSTLIMAISIPFSILLTLLIMIFTGITLNMITMTGLILGLGMVVDASVVVLENIYSYRNRGTQAATAAAIGTQEVISSVVSGNLTTICVFIPFFVYKNKLDMLGELFASLMTVIIVALLSSLFVAMFLVPVLAGKFLPVDNRKEHPIKNKFLAACDKAVEDAIKWITEQYRKGLHFVLHHRFVTVVIAFGILASSIAAFGQLRISFMSKYADSSVGLNVQLPLGTKLEETQAVLDDFYQFAIDEVKGYENIVVSVGTGSGMSFSSDTSYKGSISIYLPDASKQIDTAESIKAKLRAHFADYPVATFTFDEGRMQQMTGSDIDIALRSNDLDAALSVAKEIKTLMQDNIPDIVEPEIDLNDGLPQLEVKIDRARASSFGISVTTIANEINYCINGKTATTYHSNGDDYDVVVVLQDEDRSDIPDLEKIFVTGTDGRYAVANFAEVVRGTGPVSINREDQNRIIHLTANTSSGSNAGDVENQIKSLIADNLVIPEDVSISYEGSWGDTMNTAKVFLCIIILAIILVFGVMAGTYESFKDPFINLFTLPFLIVGVVIIHLATGQAFSMVSMIGIVMLVGIVVNNGIILVDQTNLLVRRGVDVIEACEKAGASRLRPVLMTTLTTILAMIPMAFFAGESGSMTQPIGLCVVGGLTSSTIVTLFIIPVIYSLFNKNANVKLHIKYSKEFMDEFNACEKNNTDGEKK
ncbi:MAG: efflux RND transporter permease subunit [Treponema sp.]|nr:efflux RND transporter permease subunit [Treponema sp.]